MSIAQTAEDAGEKTQRAAHEALPFIEPAARLGYVAKGIIYALIGILAFLTATGFGGNTTDQRGALDHIATAPFGSVLLYTIGVGLMCYALWRVLFAIANPESRNVLKRLGYAITGLAYGGIGISAFMAANGHKTQRNEDVSVAQVMSFPLGQLAVGLAGAIFGCVALAQIYTGIKGNFQSVLKMDQMSEDEQKAATFAGRVGLISRGIAFLLVAWFLIEAAIDARSKEAGGLDEALQVLAGQRFGPLLLALAGMGLIAYGVFMCFEAKYRKMSESMPQNPGEPAPARP